MTTDRMTTGRTTTGRTTTGRTQSDSVALAAPVGAAGPTDTTGDTGQIEGHARHGVSIAGRLGLAGRTGFYAILTGLAVRIALLGHPRHQADAAGALTIVCRSVIGQVAVGAVAVGFFLFGVGRLAGAYTDRSVGWGRRGLTVAQGAFYLAMAYVPVSFLAGNHATGSQAQQKRTAGEVLRLPAGRELIFAVGLVLVAVCVLQVRGGLRQQFSEGLDLRQAPHAACVMAKAAGTVGIPARALVFVPVGVGLMVTGVKANPGKAINTDRELLDLAAHPWGLAVLAAVALGLATFTVYSAIEARYRVVVSAR